MLTDTKSSTRYLNGFLDSPAGVLVTAMLVVFALLGGCSSSTDPEGGDPPGATIKFSPTGQGQSIRLSETMDFSVAVEPAQTLTARWYLKGQVVGQDL